MDKHEQIPFSKESCESFNGVWTEEELTCHAIEPEDCWNMGGKHELVESMFLGGPTKKCTEYN